MDLIKDKIAKYTRQINKLSAQLEKEQDFIKAIVLQDKIEKLKRKVFGKQIVLQKMMKKK